MPMMVRRIEQDFDVVVCGGGAAGITLKRLT
jgi:hypothetical protein